MSEKSQGVWFHGGWRVSAESGEQRLYQMRLAATEGLVTQVPNKESRKESKKDKNEDFGFRYRFTQ